MLAGVPVDVPICGNGVVESVDRGHVRAGAGRESTAAIVSHERTAPTARVASRRPCIGSSFVSPFARLGTRASLMACLSYS